MKENHTSLGALIFCILLIYSFNLISHEEVISKHFFNCSKKSLLRLIILQVKLETCWCKFISFNRATTQTKTMFLFCLVYFLPAEPHSGCVHFGSYLLFTFSFLRKSSLKNEEIHVYKLIIFAPVFGLIKITLKWK